MMGHGLGTAGSIWAAGVYYVFGNWAGMILVMYIVLIFTIAITITYIGTGTLQHRLVIWQLVARLDENVSVESTEEVVVDRLLSQLAPE